MNGQHWTFLLGIVVFVVVISIVIYVVKKSISPSKQKYSNMNYGDGFLPLYQARLSDTTEVEDTLKWWYTFESQLDPDVAGTVYDLCNDLQTPQSLQYYGLTTMDMETLKQLKASLANISPSSIKNATDVNKVFGPVCIKIFNREVGTVNKSGLYEEEPNIAGYTDVF